MCVRNGEEQVEGRGEENKKVRRGKGWREGWGRKQELYHWQN